MTFMLGDKTVEQWENEWKLLGVLGTLADKLDDYKKVVGVYRAELNGKIVYIGSTFEFYNNGIYKRLMDYIRPEESGRKHSSGQKMYSNKDDIIIYVLVTGDDIYASAIAKALEIILIDNYLDDITIKSNITLWNTQGLAKKYLETKGIDTNN